MVLIARDMATLVPRTRQKMTFLARVDDVFSVIARPGRPEDCEHAPPRNIPRYTHVRRPGRAAMFADGPLEQPDDPPTTLAESPRPSTTSIGEALLTTFPDGRRPALLRNRTKNFIRSSPADSNERFADLAEIAMWTTDNHGPFTDASEVLANIIHFCNRAGLDFEAVVSEARATARDDHASGPEARRDFQRYPGP